MEEVFADQGKLVVSNTEENSQDRKFCAIIYPDAENYNPVDVLSNVESCSEWVYILHDKDTNDDGELEKPHYHILIRWKNPRKLSTVANFLGIPANYVRCCKNFKAYEKYLVHRTADSRGKFHYSPLDAFCSDRDGFLDDVGFINEATSMYRYFQYIDAGHYDVHAMLKECSSLGDPRQYGYLRRNYNILLGYVKSRSFSSSSRVSVDMSLVNACLENKK